MAEAITVANVNAIVDTIGDLSQQQVPGTALIEMSTKQLPPGTGARVQLPSVGYDERTGRDKPEGMAHVFFGVDDEVVALDGLRRAWLTIRNLDHNHIAPDGTSGRVMWNLTYSFPILPDDYVGRPNGTVPTPPKASKFPERMVDYRPTVRLTGSRVPTDADSDELRSAFVESQRAAGPGHEPVPELRVAPPNAPNDAHEYTAPMTGSEVRLMRKWLEALRDRQPAAFEEEVDSEVYAEDEPLAHHVSNAHDELSTIVATNDTNPALVVLKETYDEDGSTGIRTLIAADLDTNAIPRRLLERLPNLTWHETAGIRIILTEPDDNNIRSTSALAFSLIAEEDGMMYRVEFSLDDLYDAGEDSRAIDRLPEPQISSGSPLEDLDEIPGEQEQITIDEALQILKLAEKMNDGTIQLRPPSL